MHGFVGPAPGSGLFALLFLADGRMPAGGYAHSGGLEEAVASGRTYDEASLTSYLRGRLATSGAVEAGVAVAAWAASHGSEAGSLALLESHAEARTPSPAQREASQAQGRALCRAAGEIWPEPTREIVARLAAQIPGGPMLALAGGAIGAALGLAAHDVALWSAYGTVTCPAWAATRLLGLAPYAVGRALAAVGPYVAQAAGEAAKLACLGVPDLGEALPAGGAPLSEIGAQAHRNWEVRLFAS